MLTFRGWWEYYFLRYFVGTVVGAAVVFLIPDSRATLGCPIPGGMEWKYLMALTALGFAYCYVASAPMLTLHVIRVYLFKSSHTKSDVEWTSKPGGLLWAWCAPWLLILVAAVVLAICHPGFTRSLLKSQFDKPLALLGIVFFPSILLVQIISICRAYQDRFARITAFYWKLSRARGTKLAEVAEYVESYRHMREHSNAYAIIIFEILLAPVLVLASKPWYLIAIVLLWLLPPSCCWFVATVLELKLSDHE